MQGHYGRFFVMIGLHFIAMYILMYAMVDRFDNVFNSVNQAYMAALMTASMVLIEIPLMSMMYKNRLLNAAILAAGVVALVGSFLFIRQQTAIHDRQFLRSMIPHHAGAILMCGEAQLSDPELRQLCEEIVKSQEDEIRIMKRKMQELR
jgi:xanthine/uracil permease